MLNGSIPYAFNNSGGNMLKSAGLYDPGVLVWTTGWGNNTDPVELGLSTYGGADTADVENISCFNNDLVKSGFWIM